MPDATSDNLTRAQAQVAAALSIPTPSGKDVVRSTADPAVEAQREHHLRRAADQHEASKRRATAGCGSLAFFALLTLDAVLNTSVTTVLGAALLAFLSLAAFALAVQSRRDAAAHTHSAAAVRAEDQATALLVDVRADPTAGRLAVIAEETVAEIKATHAWASAALDGHRARLNLDEELRAILRHANRIIDARHADAAATAAGVEAGAFRALASPTDVVGFSTDALRSRVTALVAYRLDLKKYDRVNAMVGLLDALQESDAESMLLDSTADSQQASDFLLELATELGEAQDLRQATLDSLAGVTPRIEQPPDDHRKQVSAGDPVSGLIPDPAEGRRAQAREALVQTLTSGRGRDRSR